MTFLVLARKAGSIGKRESVGSWLYKVAYRVALRLRARTAKRSAREEPIDELSAPEATDKVLWRDLRPVLDEEIDRLPEKYRVPFVLCYLEGQTNEEAARQLGCPKGTILSRLARGRERLRSRLARRGLALSVGGLATVLAQNASAASVPAGLVSSTLQAAIPFAAGQAATGLISAPVAALIEGVLHSMFLTQLKSATAALLALIVLGTGVGLFSYRTMAGPPEQAQAASTSQERQGAQEQRRGPERRPEERRGPSFNGTVTAISDDGKTLTLEAAARRGEEAKKHTVKLTDKTVVGFAAVLKEQTQKIKVGDLVAVWLQEGSTDSAASLQVTRKPDITGRIAAVSADEKGLTLEIPSQQRGAPPEKIDIKLTDKTVKAVSRGPEVKLQAGNVASVWLVEGSKDTAAGLLVNRPPHNAAGVITAISPDGKTLTLDARTRSGEVVKSQVNLADSTKVEFIGDEGRAKKLKAGLPVVVWLQEGSADTAAIVQVNLQRKSPDVVGVVSAISPDNKVLTLEIRTRGEETVKKVEIKLTDKTEIEYAGIDKAEEKKPTIGFPAAVWLQEGSKDTAAEVVFRKGGRERTR